MYNKLNSISFSSAFLGLLLLWSCTSTKVEDLSTELRVVVNIDSVPKANAKVKLYRTLVDMETRTAATDSGTTDAQGKVVFKGLKSVLYYVHAYYADGDFYWDNSIAQSKLNDDLVDGAVTMANIQLKNKRIALPTKLKFKSIEVISFDTVLYSKTGNQSCSNVLLFEIVGVNNGYSEITLNTIDKLRTAQYCIIDGRAKTNNSITIVDEPTVTFKNTYRSLFLNAIKLKDDNSTEYFPIEFYSSLGLNISIFSLENYWDDNAVKGAPLPNRIRLLEGQVESPRSIRTIVDIKVDWE